MDFVWNIPYLIQSLWPFLSLFMPVYRKQPYVHKKGADDTAVLIHLHHPRPLVPVFHRRTSAHFNHTIDFGFLFRRTFRQLDSQHTVSHVGTDSVLLHIIGEYQCLLELRVRELAT